VSSSPSSAATAEPATPTEPFALYVHVPWCRHVCPYCDFNVYAMARPPEASYGDALAREVAAWAAAPPWAGRRVASVSFGGGTPSLFSPAAIDGVLRAIRRAFGLVDDAEVSLEANPGTVDAASLAGYRAAGVTRLSLGVQTFDPGLLRTLGRDHEPDEARAAVGVARAAGFDDVSVDLIFGVPGQTVAGAAADVDATLALAPDHVSAYALTWEEGTPFHAWRARGRLRPVPDDAEADMAQVVDARLRAAGFERYEISSWARRGHASRHNQRYWDGSDYLGIGAGAHSFSRSPAPGVRFANARRPDEYRAEVERRGTAVETVETLTAAQARTDFVVTGLRRLIGVDLAAYRRRFDEPFDARFPHVDRLVRDGVVERTDDRLRLTARGLLFADTVAASFV